MKQILQHLKTGETAVTDVPCPQVRAGHLLVRTTTSLMSVGTERMLVDFGRANLIDKARQQPDKVRMVVEKVKTDGLQPTLEAVRNKLDQPLPLGYCNVGQVIEVGQHVAGFAVGDRVVSNGKHAEVVCVPKNLCAKIPAGVSDEAAAFTVISAIALQGIRLAQPSLGEAFVVTGLGVIGLLTVQLLRAHGCRVLGIDFDSEKLMLAEALGADTVDLSKGQDPLAIAGAFSRGRGVDGVLITASTKSNEPVHQAAVMCRKRGRIVLVGVTGLELSRADFFEKELTFQVSCSYGPGRYDTSYEEGGQDYPVGFVRWTEQRNFEAVLDMMGDGRLRTDLLVSHCFPIAEASEAYEMISSGSSSLGILFEYPSPETVPAAVVRQSTITLLPPRPLRPGSSVARVAFIGAGNYATSVLMPAFHASGAEMVVVACSGGVSGVHAGRKFGFERATTDLDEIYSDPDIHAVVISTRHNSHAGLVCRALAAGKHVFVEKPLCLSLDELTRIESLLPDMPSTALASDADGEVGPQLMVGFNRRFAPHIVKMKALLATVDEPKAFVMTVNAGAIPPTHWTQDPQVGGGRILGEACHFIDLLRFLAGAPFESYHATSMGQSPGMTVTDDKALITLKFANGCIGTIVYLANGYKAFPKERLEVFAGGRILQLDNFRRLRGYGWPGFEKMHLWRQDKGQKACVEAFVQSLLGHHEPPIPLAEILESSWITIEIAASLAPGMHASISTPLIESGTN